MSKYHSTVTRRNFMKGLGLGAAGLGAAVATAPVFRDLDELAASPTAYWKIPWWVTELEPYTASTEIDWSIMPPLGRLIRRPYQNTDSRAEVSGKRKVARISGFMANEPGNTIRDLALRNASSRNASYDSFIGPLASIETPQEMGVPRWQGTPEENSRMIRAAFKFFGAAQVGFYELETNTRAKLFDPSSYRFENVDTAYKDGTVNVIPNNCKYVIVYLDRMPEEVRRGERTLLSAASTFMGYSRAGLIKPYLFGFLEQLGYQALGDISLRVPNGVMAGLGELSRYSNVISPVYGSMVRYTAIMITDLPLASTKPIDAGIFRFCKTCKICAECCPSNALSLETEPSWDVYEYEGIPLNRTGVLTYKCDYAKCWPIRDGGAGCCNMCASNCPFRPHNQAIAHNVVRATLATTSIFNGFFATMEGTFDYGTIKKDPAEWWDLDLNEYGLDTIK